MKVAVILGGTSFERDVSLKTGKAVVKACKVNNYDVETLIIDENHKKFLPILKQADIVFNALEKKKCWILSLILSSAFFIFVLLIGRDDIFLFIIICCLTGFCLGADMFLPPSMQADVTDYHLSLIHI